MIIQQYLFNQIMVKIKREKRKPKDLKERRRTELRFAYLTKKSVRMLGKYGKEAESQRPAYIKKHRNLQYIFYNISFFYKKLRTQEKKTRFESRKIIINNLKKGMLQKLKQMYVDPTPKRERNENCHQVYEQALSVNKQQIAAIQTIFRDADFSSEESVKKHTNLLFKETKNGKYYGAQVQSANKIKQILMDYACVNEEKEENQQLISTLINEEEQCFEGNKDGLSSMKEEREECIEDDKSLYYFQTQNKQIRKRDQRERENGSVRGNIDDEFDSSNEARNRFGLRKSHRYFSEQQDQWLQCHYRYDESLGQF